MTAHVALAGRFCSWVVLSAKVRWCELLEFTFGKGMVGSGIWFLWNSRFCLKMMKKEWKVGAWR